MLIFSLVAFGRSAEAMLQRNPSKGGVLTMTSRWSISG